VAFPLVLGVLLKVEMIGYAGPAPLMPREPVAEGGREGLRTFTYDLSPSDPCLTVEDACARIGSRLERMLLSPRSQFPETEIAPRLTLDFGLIAERDHERLAYAWPADFLRVIVDADIQLNVSLYLPRADDDESNED
jgi:hypothetical protein